MIFIMLLLLGPFVIGLCIWIAERIQEAQRSKRYALERERHDREHEVERRLERRRKELVKRAKQAQELIRLQQGHARVRLLEAQAGVVRSEDWPAEALPQVRSLSERMVRARVDNDLRLLEELKVQMERVADGF